LSNAKRFAKNSLALTIASLSMILIGAVYRVFIARYLGAEDYGKYVFIVTYVSYAAPLALLGIRFVIIREIAKTPGLYKDILRESIVIRTVTTTLAFALACSILPFLNKGPIVFAGVILQGLALFAVVAMDTVESMIIAKESSKYVAASALISNLLKIGIGISLLAMGFGLLTVIGLYTVISVLHAYLSWYFFRRVFANVKPSAGDALIPNLRRFLVSQSLPFFYITIISRVYYKNDILLLSVLKGDQVVGWYGVAYLPVDALLAVASSAAAAGLPVLSRLYSENKGHLRTFHNKMCKYLVVIFLTAAIGLTAVGPDIVRLVFGERFAVAAPVLRLLVWMVPAEALTLSLAKGLVVAYQQKLMFKLTILNAIINLALCVILIPYYSYWGAAIATVISAYITAIIIMSAVHRRVHRVDYWQVWVKPLLCAGLGCFVAHLFLSMDHPWAGALLGVFTFAIMILLTRTLQLSDYETLRSIFRRNPVTDNVATM
jgi:O-antigen/teichoic acid export membrane protein